MRERPLTPRQERFIRAYLQLGNATQAAIQAGYSKKAAAEAGHHLLRNAKISARVAAPIKRLAARAELSAARVLEEMRRLAFTDFRTFYGPDGQIKPMSEWTEEMGSQAAVLETIVKSAKDGGVTDVVLKFKVHDKKAPLEMLGKHFKLVADAVQVMDVEKLNERLERGRQRYAKMLSDMQSTRMGRPSER